MLKLVTPNHKTLADGSGGVHEITVEEPNRLRLFFLSLLWRSAASSRNGFEDIAMPANDLERLRALIVSNDPGSLSFYPITLIQLSTIGDPHNLAPQVLEVAPFGNDPIFRFYFDGLVTHIYRSATANDVLHRAGLTIVGRDKKLGVITIPFGRSRQRETMTSIMIKAAEEWPEAFERLTRDVR